MSINVLLNIATSIAASMTCLSLISLYKKRKTFKDIDELLEQCDMKIARIEKQIDEEICKLKKIKSEIEQDDSYDEEQRVEILNLINEILEKYSD